MCGNTYMCRVLTHGVYADCQGLLAQRCLQMLRATIHNSEALGLEQAADIKVSPLAPISLTLFSLFSLTHSFFSLVRSVTLQMSVAMMASEFIIKMSFLPVLPRGNRTLGFALRG